MIKYISNAKVLSGFHIIKRSFYFAIIIKKFKIGKAENIT